MSDFDDVGDFHKKFGLDNVTHEGAGPRVVPDDLMEFRRKFLHEELEEFEEGLAEGDEAKMADALIDLVYVAMGTAHLRGYPWQQLWDDVQRANMSKVRAARDGHDSKRNSQYDVVKPDGWEPPAIGRLLASIGFDLSNTTGLCTICGSDFSSPTTVCSPANQSGVAYCFAAALGSDDT
jgi:predicted HAD superfamily Cof-like phosphohydrolase